MDLPTMIDVRIPFCCSNTATNLESHKGYALHRVPNKEQIFETAERRDIDSNVKECDPHEAFIKIESPDKDLGWNNM